MFLIRMLEVVMKMRPDATCWLLSDKFYSTAVYNGFVQCPETACTYCELLQYKNNLNSTGEESSDSGGWQPDGSSSFSETLEHEFFKWDTCLDFCFAFFPILFCCCYLVRSTKQKLCQNQTDCRPEYCSLSLDTHFGYFPVRAKRYVLFNEMITQEARGQS